MKIHLPAVDLPLHPTKRHPRTGLALQAIGISRRGTVIWPVLGASPDDPSNAGAEGGDDAKGEGSKTSDGEHPEGLGDAGKKALDQMKGERNAAKAQAKALEEKLAKLAPLEKLAAALGGSASGDEASDLEKLTKRLEGHEAELAKERKARERAEVIADKQLSPRQAKRLRGETREELEADADELLRDFPETAGGDGSQNGGRGNRMRPDHSQGSRGGNTRSSREAALAEAEKRFGKQPATTT